MFPWAVTGSDERLEGKPLFVSNDVIIMAELLLLERNSEKTHLIIVGSLVSKEEGVL